MLSDVPLMAYLGWNWIPFPNGLLIACFWFYRLLQLTRSSSSSSDRGARTCDLPARTSARSPLRAAGWPDTIPSISGEPWAGLAPNSLPSHGIFWSCTPPLLAVFGGRSRALGACQLDAHPRNVAGLKKVFLVQRQSWWPDRGRISYCGLPAICRCRPEV